MLPRIGHVRGAATLAEQRFLFKPARGAPLVDRASGAALRTSETGDQTFLATRQRHQQRGNVEALGLPLVRLNQGAEIGRRQRAPPA